MSDSATPWSVARQTPLSMRFSRQESWSGLPFPSPGDLPNPGIEPASLLSPALAGGFFTTSATWEAQLSHTFVVIPTKTQHACHAQTHVHTNIIQLSDFSTRHETFRWVSLSGIFTSLLSSLISVGAVHLGPGGCICSGK